jgi:hypothetical protein
MKRPLQARLALGRDVENSRDILADIDHFDQALPSPPSVLRRSAIAIAVLVMVEIIARVPLTPIEFRNPKSKLVLAPLTQAFDLNPGHVADAVDQLLHSSVSSLSSLIATLALGAYVVLRPSLFSYAQRRAILGERRRPGFGPTTRRLAREASLFRVWEKQERAFSALGSNAPATDAIDLAVKALLAATALALGTGWIAAYSRGFQGLVALDTPTIHSVRLFCGPAGLAIGRWGHPCWARRRSPDLPDRSVSLAGRR